MLLPANPPQIQRFLALPLALAGTLLAHAAHAEPWQPVAAPQLPAPLYIDARLRIDTAPEVSARVWLGRRSEACVRVTAPRPQRIWSAHGGSAVYDVGADQVMRFGGGKGATPLFEALLVGLARTPAPLGARLVERKTVTNAAGSQIDATWAVRDAAGRDAGHVRVVEGRDGPQRIELRDADDRLLRRYRMGPRRTMAGVAVPESVAVEVHSRQGRVVRREAWRLQPIAGPAPDLASEPRCLELPPNVREVRL